MQGMSVCLNTFVFLEDIGVDGLEGAIKFLLFRVIDVRVQGA